MPQALYQYTMPGASHWSFKVKKGITLKITDTQGGANLGVLFFNPENLLEKYNAPDTLKCQHTFKLTQGHCLYSYMGRIFCSITEDSLGWHETICGNSTAKIVEDQWGARDYQSARNEWQQNGYDSFLVELAKYGLTARDMAANLNLFSKVCADEAGNLQLDSVASKAGSTICLRFEMDTLVVMHTCPHPMNKSDNYPFKPVNIEFIESEPLAADDLCMNLCSENKRGFENNRLYHLGASV